MRTSKGRFSFSSGVLLFFFANLLLFLTVSSLFAREAQGAQQTVIRGTVTDRSTGAPIAGATVKVLSQSGSPSTTDANGVYELKGDQVDTTTGTLLIQSDEFFGRTQAFIVTTPLPVTVDVDLLPGGSVLEGVVQNVSTGSPVAGASVLYQGGGLVPGPTTISAQTDASGFYAFDSSRFIESASSGFTGSVSANASGFITPSFSLVMPAPPFPATKDIELIPSNVVVLEGTVTNRSTGAPIAGATVDVLSQSGGPVTTDVNGVYQLIGSEVRRDTGTVLIQANAHFSVTKSFSITTPLPVTLNADLLPGGSVLEGVVQNAVTSAPVSGATVLYQGGGLVPGPTTISAQTDASGFYAFDSSRFMEFAANGFNGSVSASASDFLTPSFSSVSPAPPFPATKDIVLIPGADVVLQGWVSGRTTGAPIAGATVDVLGQSGGPVTTDVNGEYELRGSQVRRDSGTLLFQADGRFGVTKSFALTIPLPLILDADLLQGGPVLEGFVTNEITGVPIAGASVLYQGGGLVPGPTTISVQTDNAGFYSFDSRRFLDSASNGFSGGVTADASGFLRPPFVLVTPTPPFPGEQDITLIPTVIPDPPTLVSVDPSSGPTSGGQTVFLTGTSFIVGVTSVAFDGTQALSVNVMGDSTLEAVTPPHAAGVVDVAVTTPLDSFVLSGAYTYILDDSEGDGIPDSDDNCPNDPNPDQEDADQDGVGDACDICLDDPEKIEPGICGCGFTETDTDSDGTPDCVDSCPIDPNKIEPGVCGCGVADTDTLAPSISCPADVVTECAGPTGTAVSYAVTAVDQCDGDLVPVCDPSSGDTFPLGAASAVQCSATDASGNTAQCGFTVSVQDTTPPTVSSVSATPDALWPPNHKMKAVTFSAETDDACNPESVSCNIKEIASNEPENGLGDGDTAPDYEITGDLTAKLRAERSGTGDGRIYTITVECTDSAGNSAANTTAVVVPHDIR